MEDSQEHRKDLPIPLAAALWLVCSLFWGGAIFMGYRSRVLVVLIGIVMVCGFLFWSYCGMRPDSLFASLGAG